MELGQVEVGNGVQALEVVRRDGIGHGIAADVGVVAANVHRVAEEDVIVKIHLPERSRERAAFWEAGTPDCNTSVFLDSPGLTGATWP
jgi:hypothetical protein